MYTCSMFASYTSYLSRELEKTDFDLASDRRPSNMSKKDWKRFCDERSSRHSESTAGNDDAARAARLEKIDQTLQKYEHNFSKHLQILLDSLNHYAATETVVLLGLCARLSTANQGTSYSGLKADEDGDA